jgi:AcrR family transcriptional regulator
MAVASKPEADGKQRSAIISSAMHLFGKQGFTGTSMRDIANAVGLLPGSLYAHINGKEGLLFEIVTDGIGRFIAAVQSHASADSDPVERMRKMIVAHVEVVADNPERSQVVFHQWRYLEGDNLPEAIARRHEYENYFIRVFQDGVAAGKFRPEINYRIAVLSILGALNWTPEWFSPNGKLSASSVGECMADTLLGGILSS